MHEKLISNYFCMKSSNRSPEECDNEMSKMQLLRFYDRNIYIYIYIYIVKFSRTKLTTNSWGSMAKSDL